MSMSRGWCRRTARLGERACHGLHRVAEDRAALHVRPEHVGGDQSAPVLVEGHVGEAADVPDLSTASAPAYLLLLLEIDPRTPRSSSVDTTYGPGAVPNSDPTVRPCGWSRACEWVSAPPRARACTCPSESSRWPRRASREIPSTGCARRGPARTSRCPRRGRADAAAAPRCRGSGSRGTASRARWRRGRGPRCPRISARPGWRARRARRSWTPSAANRRVSMPVRWWIHSWEVSMPNSS